MSVFFRGAPDISMNYTVPPFDALPLPLAAREEATGDMTNALQTRDAAAAGALALDAKKLQQQHEDCLPGPSGARHPEQLGACAVGTRWLPDDPVQTCKLQFERLADLEAKVVGVRAHSEAQEHQIQSQKRQIESLEGELREAKALVQALFKPWAAPEVEGVGEGSGQTESRGDAEGPMQWSIVKMSRMLVPRADAVYRRWQPSHLISVSEFITFPFLLLLPMASKQIRNATYKQ